MHGGKLFSIGCMGVLHSFDHLHNLYRYSTAALNPVSEFVYQTLQLSVSESHFLFLPSRCFMYRISRL